MVVAGADSETVALSPASNEPKPKQHDEFSSATNTTNVSLSVLLLNLVAILWGSQHAIIKTVVSDTSNPAAFTLLRFGLAALIASPYTPLLPMISKGTTVEKSTATTIHNTWRWGLEMGFWMFLGFGFQAIGLEFTSAQKSGFLLYLNVKFVPFLAFLLLGRQITGATWLSALTAFTGTGLLAMDGGGSLDLNTGDLWTIAAAAASAMFILRLEKASAAVPDAAALNAACLWVVTVLSTAWTVAQLGLQDTSTVVTASAAVSPIQLLWSELVRIATTHPLELVYLGGVTTAFANWIQTKAQRDITAERASVIYAMDPVYGAGFAYLLLGETLNGVTSWLGAGLITVAAATNAFLDVSHVVEEEKEHLDELVIDAIETIRIDDEEISSR